MDNNIVDKRTKGEWFISGGMVDGYELRSTNGEVIINNDQTYNGLHNRANAAFICKAVNNYDSLLEACKTALEYRKQTHHHGDDKCLNVLMEAIKKAEQ